VGSVLATDADAGSNGAVRYKLDPSSSAFKVDEVSGEISLLDKTSVRSQKR
jgi:hypothetical protein